MNHCISSLFSAFVSGSRTSLTFTVKRLSREKLRHIQLVLHRCRSRRDAVRNITHFKISITLLPSKPSSEYRKKTVRRYSHRLRNQSTGEVYDVIDLSQFLISPLSRHFDGQIRIETSRVHSGKSRNWSRRCNGTFYDVRDKTRYPLLVLFSNFNVPQLLRKPNAINHLQRDSTKSRERRSKVTAQNETLTDEEPIKELPCRVHQWRISFSDLGWDNFMIAPKWYNANFCEGTCAEVAAEEGVAISNHAFMRGLYRASVNTSQSEMVPTPCCVPLRYGAISLLFVDQIGHYNVRHVKQLKAESCACL